MAPYTMNRRHLLAGGATLAGTWGAGCLTSPGPTKHPPTNPDDQKSSPSPSKSQTMTRPDNAPSERPNIVVILTDDQGYGDVNCYPGSDDRIVTPRLDGMAEEGLKLTSFYSASPVCTPARAALLTGTYPARMGLAGTIFGPGDGGLDTDEITIADRLSDAGYATHCIGKWHLGDQDGLLPPDQGFDSWFGLPYSNDMTPDNPDKSDDLPPLPLMRDSQRMESPSVLERDPDQSQLTRRYTDEATEYIESQAGSDEPFFLYLAHTMPHHPIAVSEEFDGATGNGLYADVIRELDHSTGQILDTLAETGIDEDTLVLYTSDNGPWIGKGPEGQWGSAGPLSDGKFSSKEGGVRVPCIARWPGTIPAGTTSSALTTIMDIMPTCTHLAGETLPGDRVIDGHDLWQVMTDPEHETSANEAFFYYGIHFGTAWGRLDAVRDASGYKYWQESGRSTSPGDLFDLTEDPGEGNSIATDHPAIVDRLKQRLTRHEADIDNRSRT